MNVLLLSAGYGTRLKEITTKIPKCLVRIGKEAIIDIWLNKLKKIHLNRIFINTHYKHKLVEKHLKDNIKNFNIEILYEEKLLGTAGTLYENLNDFKYNDLMVIHCDNFTNFDLNDLINAHKKRPKKCEISMLTFKTSKPTQSGIVITDKNKILKEYYEKPDCPPGNIANAAIYILSKKFLNEKYSEFGGYKDFASEVIPKLTNKIFTYKTDDFFIDIGDTTSLNIAKKWLKNNKI